MKAMKEYEWEALENKVVLLSGHKVSVSNIL